MAKGKRTKLPPTKQAAPPGQGRLPPARAVPPANSGTPPPDGTIGRGATALGPNHQMEVETAFGEADENAVRYIYAGGPPTQQQLNHAQSSALMIEGEMMNLVWVNQNDLRNLGVRFDIPEHCPECGRPNEVEGG